MKMKMKNKPLSTLLGLTTLMAGLPAVAEVDTQIVGGKVTTPYSRPYQVALLMNGNQGCGGTLISPNWVLTAAHCLDSASTASLTVRVGAHSISRNDGQTIRVSQIINHENWRGANGIRSGYDIGLLRLATPARSEYTPAKLPTAQIEQQYANVGDAVTVSGWGLTSNRGRPSDVLREVNLPVISNSSCSSELNFNLPSSVVCGGGAGGVSACNGDSGGPYAVKVGGDFYSIGTVSWGQACRGATAFTRTTSYVNWIKDKTGIDGSDLTADFNYSVNGNSVSFNSTSQSDKGIVQSSWNFGDGNTAEGSSVSNTYDNEGAYNVTLTVKDSTGKTDTITQIVSISGPDPQCAPAWVATKAYALGDKVSFEGKKYRATWWSTGAQPSIYTNVWALEGACDNTDDDKPNADFSFTVSGLGVSFTNLSTDDKGIETVSWSFGDNTGSEQFSPSHTYGQSGTYRVTLTVTDAEGQAATLSKSVTVQSGDTCSDVDTWSASKVYLKGQRAALNGVIYTAQWWVQGENPQQSGPWGAWRSTGNCQ